MTLCVVKLKSITMKWLALHGLHRCFLKLYMARHCVEVKGSATTTHKGVY
jgi:hypothetical protein